VPNGALLPLVHLALPLFLGLGCSSLLHFLILHLLLLLVPLFLLLLLLLLLLLWGDDGGTGGRGDNGAFLLDKEPKRPPLWRWLRSNGLDVTSFICLEMLMNVVALQNSKIFFFHTLRLLWWW
jgi:hypothetical protein